MNTVPPFVVSQETLTDWLSNVRRLSDELGRRREQIEEMTADIASRDSEISRLGNDLEEQKELVDVLKTTLDEVHRAHENEMKQLGSQLRDAEAQCRQSEGRLREIEGRVEAQDAKLAEKDRTISQLGTVLQKRERELRSQVRGVGEDVRRLKRSVGDLNGNVTGEIDKLGKAHEKLTKVDDLTQTCDVLAERIEETVDDQLTRTSEKIRRATNRRAAELRKNIAATQKWIDDAVRDCVGRLKALKAEMDSGHRIRSLKYTFWAVLGIVATAITGIPVAFS